METNKIDAAKIFVFFVFTVIVGYFVFFSGGNSGQQARVVITDQTKTIATDNVYPVCPSVCGAFNVNQLLQGVKMPTGCKPGVYDDKASGAGACSATIATSTGQCLTYKGRWQITLKDGVQDKFCYTGMSTAK